MLSRHGEIVTRRFYQPQKAVIIQRYRSACLASIVDYENLASRAVNCWMDKE